MPIYESERDRVEQRRLAVALAARLDAHLIARQTTSSMDYWLERGGRIVGWVECKRRAYNSGTLSDLGGVFMDLHKWAQARARVAVAMDTIFHFCLGLDDGDFVMSLAKDSPEWDRPVFIGGRNDRNDRNDTDLVVKLPLFLFARM